MSDPLLTAAANLEAVQRENAELQRKRDLDQLMIQTLASDLDAALSQAATLKAQLAEAQAGLDELARSKNVAVNKWVGRLKEAEADRYTLRTRNTELEQALGDLMPFVLDDYMPDFATPAFKAAVEKARAALRNPAAAPAP